MVEILYNTCMVVYTTGGIDMAHPERPPVPIYYQIKQDILEKILSGELNPEDKIPSEEKLAQQYSISRMTARHAVTELVNDGHLYRVHGKGTFVSRPRVEKSFAYLTGFATDMVNKGYRPSSKVLHMARIRPDREVAGALHMKPREEVYEIVRIRMANEKPLAYQKTYLPVRLFPDLDRFDFAQNSLYQTLADEYGTEPEYAQQRMDGRNVRGEIARSLGVKEGAAVLFAERVAFMDNGKPMEIVYSWYRGDKFVFEVTLYKEQKR